MTVSSRDARFALWVLFGINLLNFFDRTLGFALAEPKRLEFDLTDATMEPDPGPPPEAVFDRMTGPWDRRRATWSPVTASSTTAS